MMRAWAAVILFSTGLRAGDIFGTVMDKHTGKPIGEARVVATVFRGGDQPFDIVVLLTDEDGRFRFIGMPDGGCTLRPEKAGYSFAYPSDSIGARPGSAIRLDLARTPTDALIVSVVDEAGFPVAGAGVRIEAKEQPFPYLQGGATAKDGSIRTALPRGAYRIAAMSPGVGTLIRLRNRTFPPTYYPSTTDANRAEWVEVVPGKETQVTVQVTPVSAREIRGRLGFPGRLIQVFIRPAGSQSYEGIWGLPQVDSEAGEFRIFGLAPGAYTLDVNACLATPCMSAATFSRAVTVSDADMKDLVIVESDRTAR